MSTRKDEANEVLHDFQEKLGAVTYSLEIMNSCMLSDPEFCREILGKILKEKEVLMEKWDEVKVIVRSHD